MDRQQKAKLVSDLRDVFSASTLMVVARHEGMSVAQSTRLRIKMREDGARFRVVKNRLARIALEGTPCAALSPLFKGPVAVAYSDDPVAAARVAVSYAEEEEGKLEILGGSLGERQLGVDGVVALAKLPSLEESRAKIAGLLCAPASRAVQLLEAPASQLVRVLSLRPAA